MTHHRVSEPTRRVIAPSGIAAVAIAVFAAAAVGLYVAGLGGASAWFVVSLAVLTFVGICVGARHRALGVDPSSSAEGVVGGAFWRGTLFVLASAATVGLAWLVRYHEPLPAVGFRTAALVTTVFAVAVIASVLYVHRLPLLSFPGLFLGMTFVFTCSPLILFLLQGRDAFRFWELVDVASVLAAMPVVMLAFSSFAVGALLARPSPRAGDAPRDRVVRENVVALRRVGLVLYVLSILVVAAATLRGSGLNLIFEGGYPAFAGARKEGQLSQFVVGSLAWFLPWSLLILAATSRDRRSYAGSLLLALPALSIILFAGDRGGALSVVLLLASAGLLLGLRIDWKRSLVVLAVVAMLFSTVQVLRQTPASEWTPQFVEESATGEVQGSRTYQQSFHEAVLTGAAPSYQTLMATVMEVPENASYRYGRDYLRSVFGPVPFTETPRSLFGLELGREHPSEWVKSILNPDRWAGTGYLQAAEAYLEFGAFGVVVLYAFLGWGVVTLWDRLAARRPDARTLAFSLILMQELLILVRNDSGGVVRTLVWGWLVVYAGPWLIERTGFLAPAGVRSRYAERPL
jgi:O-antigen polysaccharide polymerase Wzy